MSNNINTFRSPSAPRPAISESLRQRIANIAGGDGKYRILGNNNSSDPSPQTIAAGQMALKINRWNNTPIPPREAAPKPPPSGAVRTAEYAAATPTQSPNASTGRTGRRPTLPVVNTANVTTPLRRPLDSAQQVPTIITPTEEIRPAVIAKQPHEKAVPAPPKDPLAKSGSRSNGGNRLRHDDTLPKTAAKDIADQNERLRIIEQTRARLLGIPATLPVSPAPINQHAKQQSGPSSPTAAAAVDIGKSSQHAIKQQQQQQQPSQKRAQNDLRVDTSSHNTNLHTAHHQHPQQRFLQPLPGKQPIGMRESSQSSLSPRPKKESFFPARTVFNNNNNNNNVAFAADSTKQTSSNAKQQPLTILESHGNSPSNSVIVDPMAKTLPRRPTVDEGTASARLKEMEQKYTDAQQQIHQLTAQCDRHYKEMEAKEQAVRMELSDLAADRLKQQMDRLMQTESQLKSIQVKLEQTESQLTQVTNERDKMQVDGDRLRVELEAINVERGELKELCSAMEGRLEELEGNLKAAQEQREIDLDDLKAKHTAETEQLKTEMVKRLAKLKERVVVSERERKEAEEASRRDFEEMLNAYDALQAELDAALAHADQSMRNSSLSSQSSLEEAADRLADLTFQLAERDRHIAELMSNKSGAKIGTAESVKYVASDKDLMDFIELMTNKTDAYRQELAKLREENQQLRSASITRENTDQHNVDPRADVLRRDFESLSEREARLQKEYDGLLIEFNRTTLQICEQDQENRDLRELVGKLRSEIERTQRKLDDELSRNLGVNYNNNKSSNNDSDVEDEDSVSSHMRAEFRRLLEEARTDYFESIKHEMELRSKAERAMREMKHELNMEIFAKHTATTQTLESHLMHHQQ